MNNFNDMLSKAKIMQEKMQEVQKNLKNVEVEGVSGGNSVKVILKGDYEMKSIYIDELANYDQLTVSSKTNDNIFELQKKIIEIL